MAGFVALQKGATLTDRQGAAAHAIRCSLRTVQKAMMTEPDRGDQWMLGARNFADFCECSDSNPAYILFGTEQDPSPIASSLAGLLETQLATDGAWRELARFHKTGVDGQKAIAFLRDEYARVARGLVDRYEAEMALNTALSGLRVGRQRLADDHRASLSRAITASDAPVRDRAQQLLRDSEPFVGPLPTGPGDVAKGRATSKKKGPRAKPHRNPSEALKAAGYRPGDPLLFDKKRKRTKPKRGS